MAIDELILRESILPHDLEVFGKILADIGQLIEQNSFSERIKFLLNNQNLSYQPVLNTKGEISPPNCLGTAFFVAGVGSFDYPYHAYEDELNEYMKQPGPRRWDDCFFVHEERRIPGAFAFSYSFESDGWHAGVYLGMVGDEHVLFAQHGHGENFGPESLRNYTSPTYYIPKTLSKDN